MKFRALLFGVAILFTLVPAAALATTTPITQKPYCTLSASRSAVELGKTVNLSWQSQYATQGFITSIGTVGTNGMQGVIPTGSGTTYVGTFTGPGGTGNCSITISIIQPNGIVPEPDKLPPSQSADSPTTLPPANDIMLSNTQSKGLIPCSGIDCQACHLASLAQRIINFLIGLSIPLAAAMFAYAGVIYFTSGVVDKIEKAHKIFKSVGIGFMIVLGAWLGIQTVLKTILADEYYKSWNTIQCVGTGARIGTDPNKPISINSLLSVLPGLNTLAPAPTSIQTIYDAGGNVGANVPGGGFYDVSTGCRTGAYLQSDGQCMDAFGSTYAPVDTNALRAGGFAGTAQWNQQLTEACSKNGLDDCLIAQSVLFRESGGQAGAVSNKGAGGLLQIMPATARGLDPDRLGGMSDAEVRQILTSEPFYNLDLGTKELSRLNTKYQGDVASIAAAYNGGDKANVCGRDCMRECGGGTAWQCNAFPGYAETRKYVPNVVATYKSLRK